MFGTVRSHQIGLNLVYESMSLCEMQASTFLDLYNSWLGLPAPLRSNCVSKYICRQAIASAHTRTHRRTHTHTGTTAPPRTHTHIAKHSLLPFSARQLVLCLPCSPRKKHRMHPYVEQNVEPAPINGYTKPLAGTISRLTSPVTHWVHCVKIPLLRGG